MPVIPNFSAFAPTPDLAGAYLHGVSIAQEAQQHAQALQLQQQKLAQDAQQAEMEFTAKQAMFEKQQLRQQQEMELNKAYQEAQLGLKQRQLEESAKVLDFKVGQAARESQVQMQAQKRIQAGEDPTKVWMELGPQAGVKLPAGLFKPATSPTDFGPAIPLEGAPGMFQAQTSAGARKIFAAPKTAQPVEAKSIPGTTDYIQVGERVLRKPDAVRPLQTDLNRLTKQQEDDKDGQAAVKKKNNKSGDWNDYLEQDYQRYMKRAARITDLESQIDSLRTSTETSAKAPASAGRFVWDPKQKKLLPKGQ